MRKLFVIGAGLIMTLTLTAQDSTQVTTLKEVVISATRSEQTVIEVPRSVAVIGPKEIKNAVYQSVGDLLNAQPGLFVVGANQTPGTNQNIFMRGTNSNQVAVLVDGVRITDASSPNAAIDLSEMSLINVERIEVIRGSHSTVYGGSAVGGVINIITKTGAEAGFHGDVSWQVGSLGNDAWTSTENMNLNYAVNTGWYINGSLYRQDVEGLNASRSELPTFLPPDGDDFQKTDFSMKGGLKNEIWDASLSFKKVHQYTEIDDGAFIDDDNHHLLFDRKALQYSAERKLTSSISASVMGSLSESERFYEDDSSQVAAGTWDHVYAAGTYFAELQTHELQFNYQRDRVRGLFGGGLYREAMRFDNYLLFNDPSFPFEIITNYDTIDSKATTGYLFAQFGYSSRSFNISGGMRASRHTTAGNFVTFELNPSWSFDNLLLYASLSTGFNAPSLYQVYDPSKNFGAYATRGNRSLEAEESVSYEVGVKKQFRSGSYLTLSAYQTNVSNSIEYVYLWNGQRPIEQLEMPDDRGDRYINVASQIVRGLELEGLIRFSPALSIQGNASFLRAEVAASPKDIAADQTGGNHVQLYNLGVFLDENFQDDQVVRRPNFTAYSRVTYRAAPELSFYTTYRYTGSRFDAGYDGSLGPYGALARIEVDAYHLLDVGIAWEATSLLSLALKIENVLDAGYREVVGFQTRGRCAYLKATLSF